MHQAQGRRAGERREQRARLRRRRDRGYRDRAVLQRQRDRRLTDRFAEASPKTRRAGHTGPALSDSAVWPLRQTAHSARMTSMATAIARLIFLKVTKPCQVARWCRVISIGRATSMQRGCFYG